MIIVVFILAVVSGLFPSKLFVVNGINLLNLSIVFILFKYLFARKTHSNKALILDAKDNLRMKFLFFVFFVSFVNMLLTQHKINSWIVVYLFYYAYYWVLLIEINSIDKLRIFFKFIVVIILIESFYSYLMFFMPNLFGNIFQIWGLGEYRSDLEGIKRFFFPSSTYVYLLAIFFMCLIIFNVNQLKKNDIILMIILIFFEFFIIFIISSLRTYFIGFIVTIILIFFYFSKNRIKILLSVLSFLLFLSFVNIAKYNNYLYDRFGFLENLMYFDIGGVFSGNFIYGFKEFDTYYWRLMEIIYVNGFKFEWYQLLFGNMGRYYEFNGFYAIAPHISYFGVFYLFGLVGVIGVYYTYIYFTL